MTDVTCARTVYLSHHHDINRSHKSRDTPTPFQLAPFRRVQRRRLVRPIHVRHSAAHHLVREAPPRSLAPPDTLHPALPGVQPSTRRIDTVDTTHHQFRLVVHVTLVYPWDQQRIRVEHVPDRCALSRAQSTAEGSQRRRRPRGADREFLPSWRIGDREWFELYRARDRVLVQPVLGRIVVAHFCYPSGRVCPNLFIPLL